MQGFFNLLSQPEYVHTLLNPLPVYGLATAWIALLAAFVARNRVAEVISLSLLFLFAISAWPVAKFGKEAKDRLLSMENETGQQWLEEHEERADQLVVVFYVLAAVAALAVALPSKWPRARIPLTAVTLLLGVVALGCGAYIGYAGGKIRHREFRLEPPAKTSHG